MTTAMKARDTIRVAVLRSLMSACTNELVTKGKKPQDELTDSEVVTVIRRAVKQRKDALQQFASAGRDDLATHERDELAILETYLPQPMSRSDIEKIAKEKIATLGITDKTKVGVLIGAIMREAAGKADGGDVKAVVDSLL